MSQLDSSRRNIEGGLLDGLREGSIIVNHGTGTPGNARMFAAAGARANVDVLDAPVSGGRPGTLSRGLLTMVGGPAAATERCRPIFQSFSRDVVHLGGPGSGQTAKLFNNALMIMNQASIADVFELASKSDADPLRLFEVLKNASAGSTVLGLFNTMITPDTVGHLAEVQGLDLDIFDAAMLEVGLDASAVTARGRSGNSRVAGLVAILNP